MKEMGGKVEQLEMKRRREVGKQKKRQDKTRS